MTKFGRKRLVAVIALLIGATSTLILAIIFDTIVNAIIKEELNHRLPIQNGSYAYGFWKDPPVPVRFGIHVFDIVNPDEIENGEEVPAVVDKGPYVYDVTLHKQDIVWHDNGTVSYVQKMKYVFNRELSVGPDTDTFTTINFPYITIASVMRGAPGWLQKFIDAFLKGNNEKPFVTVSVHDIWWGYPDPVLEEVAKTLHKYNISIPFISGKFGFYTDRNNTDDGRYAVFDGVDGDFSKYITIDQWNGLKKLNYWKNDYANEIRGTAGALYPPYITPSTKLSMYDSNLKRSLNLVYNRTSSYKGVRGLRFKIPFTDFENGTENPNNLGFCTPNANSCIPSGAYNFSEQSYYAPMYISLPHFVGGDKYYQNLVKGLEPDVEKHQPFFDIHALTGVCLQAARRYQLVARTEKYEYFSGYKNFPFSYLPILWIDGVAQMDDSIAGEFRDQIQTILDALPKARIGMFALSAVLLIVVIAIVLHWRKQKKRALYKYEILSERKPLVKNKSKRKGSTFSVNSVQRSTENGSLRKQVSGVANGVAGNAPFIAPEVEAMNSEGDVDKLVPTASFDGASQYYEPKAHSSPETVETYKSFREVDT